MANDKAKNNAYNRAQGQKYQAQAREYEAKHAANEEKLRRLREAKKKLETAITDYDFKGDIRNKFKTSVKTVTKDINSDINKHQANLSSLSGKIAGLELEQGNLLSWAANAWDTAANFFKSLV